MNVSEAEISQSIKRKRIKTKRNNGSTVIDFFTQGPIFIGTSQRATPSDEVMRQLGLEGGEPPKQHRSNEGAIQEAVSLANAKKIQEKYKAQKAKLDYEKEAGTVIKTQLVRDEWARIAVQLRKSVLGIPDRVAPLVAAEDDARRCWALIDYECRLILEDLVDAIKRGETTSSSDIVPERSASAEASDS
jgi:hypothetical protein